MLLSVHFLSHRKYHKINVTIIVKCIKCEVEMLVTPSFSPEYRGSLPDDLIVDQSCPYGTGSVPPWRPSFLVCYFRTVSYNHTTYSPVSLLASLQYCSEHPPSQYVRHFRQWQLANRQSAPVQFHLFCATHFLLQRYGLQGQQRPQYYDFSLHPI